MSTGQTRVKPRSNSHVELEKMSINIALFFLDVIHSKSKMTTVKYSFRSPSLHRSFSNLTPCSIRFEYTTFSSAEQLYKYVKSAVNGDPVEAQRVPSLTDPWALQSSAKGNTARWDAVKFDVMVGILCLKFHQNPELGRLLKQTGDAVLIEDTFSSEWGEGRNGKG
ncbi:MAG: NADAR family protein, partial [Gammaproteobacteria bacterium]|nr:NADAR family protein [Gammaproteobacteria bacterium]